MATPENFPGEPGDRPEPSYPRDGSSPSTVDTDTAVILLGAGVTAITHPLLYVKLLIQVTADYNASVISPAIFGLTLTVL